jgi:hypothetical protein
MPRFFYGNFDFEETLAAPRRRRSSNVERILAELAATWIAVAESGDLIWCPQPIDEAFFDRLAAAGLPQVTGVSRREEIPAGCELIPWGWTLEVVDLAERVGVSVDAPPLEAVRAVNSRQFARGQELARGLALPGSGVAREWAELTGLLDASLSEQWVIKSEFSQAGRDRFRVDLRGDGDIETARAWATARLRAGAALFVEPWLNAEAEAGIQLTVQRDGRVDVEGIAGTEYRGGALAVGDFSLSDDEVDLWSEATAIAKDVARAAAGVGYFGPLGIDAMRYRDRDGTLRVRAIQDVNARWTMGRLCLGHRRLLRPGERGRWLFGPTVADLEGSTEVACRRIIHTSPQEVAGQPVRLRSAVVIDSSS